MLVAFLIVAAVIAILIVGPAQALFGAGYRLVQAAGFVASVLFAGFVMTYVLPVLLLVVLAVACLALIVCAFVWLFGGLGSSRGGPPAITLIDTKGRS